MARPDLIAALEASPQGLSLGGFEAVTSGSATEIAAAVASAVSEGWLEPWPFWQERFRATISVGSSYLRAVAELRAAALSLQCDIHGHVGAPVTLHLLLGKAHAVIERYPVEHSDAVADERKHYATPRPLKAGATAKALLACLPEEARRRLSAAADSLPFAEELTGIRHQGFCLADAASVPGGWVMSSAIVAPGGFPVGALCTYGSSAEITTGQVRLFGPILADAARRLSSRTSTAPIVERICSTLGLR